MYGPDYLSSDDEDGFSDDKEYYEFKKKIPSLRRIEAENQDFVAEQKKQQLKSIFSAISFGNSDVVFQELDKGLPIDVELEFGWTPLLLAATTANESVISGLIERGAKVNQTRDGTTPLMYLCSINSTDEKIVQNILICAKLLVDKGADVNIIDKKRKTAIMFAANNGHIETVNFLLPLVDKEAEDNQRWTVLFWAIDGNQPKIVQYLLEEGLSYDKKDLRGLTPPDLAHFNGFNEVLDLFPKDPFEEFYVFYNSNQLNFEETFDRLGKNGKPQFFTDICKILYGSRSEQVIPLFLENNIDLFDFLSFTERNLEEMNIQFPFQRKRIMNGLHSFHTHAFKPQSIPFIKKDQIYSNLDIAGSILTCVKQLVAMEASLKFIVNNGESRLNLVQTKEVNILLSKIRLMIGRMKVITERLNKKSKQWDLMVKPVDKITKKRINIPWCNLWMSFGVVSLFILYKYF